MLSRWVPRAKTRSRSAEMGFGHGLVRNILITLLMLSLLPVIVVGSVHYFRSRDLLRSQASRQIENLASYEINQLEQFIEMRENNIDNLITGSGFSDRLLFLVKNPDSFHEDAGDSSFLFYLFQTEPKITAKGDIYQIVVLSPNGSILIATDDQWANALVGKTAERDLLIQERLGNNSSFFAFNEHDRQLNLLTARYFREDQDKLAAAIISSSPAQETLQMADSILPGVFGYYFDQTGRLFSDTNQQKWTQVEHPELVNHISPLLGQKQTQTQFSTTLQDGTPVIAFARWLPSYNIGVLLGVSERSVLEQHTLLDPFNAVLLCFILIITGGLIFFASTRLINPLIHLAEVANRFSNGNLLARARISRNDEIGLLAYTFNQMADQLSEVNKSAEEVVDQRTNLLNQAMRMIAQAQSETEVIQYLADTFTQLPFVGAVFELEADEINVLFITEPNTGQIEKGPQNIKVPFERLDSLLRENRIVYIEDISGPADYENILLFLQRQGCKSAVLAGVVTNARLSKVIVLGARELSLINKTALQPYANLAEVVSATLDKLGKLSALQQRLSELQILANFSQSISAETDLQNLYRVLHKQIIQTFGLDLEFAVALYNQKKNQIEFPYSFEKGQPVSVSDIPFGSGLTSALLQSRETMLLPDEKSIRAESGVLFGDPAKSWMGIPLIFAGDILGAVILQDRVNENRFTQNDVSLLTTLAPQIATAVRNTQLYTETQQALSAYEQERFLLNTLLEHIPEKIAFKDSSGRYIRASSSIATQFNVSQEVINGKTDYDLLPSETASFIYEHEQRVLNSGIAEISVIEPLSDKDSQQEWSLISRIPITLPEGEIDGILTIQQDITELKQAEALAQQRAEQVTIAAEIARDATSTLDVAALLNKAVNLISKRFGFYHAAIFLIDPDAECAVLREATGEKGQQLLQIGHRLAVGSKSIVGQVSASGEALIVNNIHNNPAYFTNPLLPETQSELAIPLKVGERVLGVLDVQSTHINAFKSEDTSVLGVVADQLAVTLVNGELFAKTQELLGKHRLLRQVSLAASTSSNLQDALLSVVKGLLLARVGERVAILMLNEEDRLQVQASAGYETRQHLETRIELGQGITNQAAVEKRPILVDNTLSDPRYIEVDQGVGSELAIPILFNEELIGVLNLESTHVKSFDENDLEILGALGNNLGAVIANIRLIDQVRRQVAREQQLFEITSKIRRSVELQSILETSTQEICRVLGARRAKIQITAGSPLHKTEDRDEHTDPGSNRENDNGHKTGWGN